MIFSVSSFLLLFKNDSNIIEKVVLTNSSYQNVISVFLCLKEAVCRVRLTQTYIPTNTVFLGKILCGSFSVNCQLKLMLQDGFGGGRQQSLQRSMLNFGDTIMCKSVLKETLLLNLRKITFFKFSILYYLSVFFWVFPRHLIMVCRRFGTLYLFHLQRLGVKYITCILLVLFTASLFSVIFVIFETMTAKQTTRKG